MSKRSMAGLVIGAGGLLAAACATTPHAAPDPQFDLAGMDTSPAPRSTLISRPDLRFSIAKGRKSGADLTLLVHETASGESLPVAAIVYSPSTAGEHVAVRRLAIPGAAPDPVLDIAILEHLYVLAVEQPPTAAFCLAPAGGRCDATKNGESHAELLHELVEARERALGAARDGAPAVHWRAVSMTPAATHTPDPDEVAVRVAANERPLPGANVFFSRAPHSGCAARSTADGVAACKLVDFHGDDDADEGAPVVATFPGDVGAERVLVPSTYMLPPDGRESIAKGSK